MTLSEAIEAFERDFMVLECAPYHGTDAPDLSRCPTGEPYEMLTSGGVRAESAREGALFAREDDAVEAWLKAAWSYAERAGGNTLYWAVKPVYSSQEFFAMDQAGLMNDPMWRGSIVIRLGTVHSKLAIGGTDRVAAVERPAKRGKK